MRFYFRARGPYALWCPAWLRADPLSEPVPTPSALGGLLRSLVWKPEWSWEICRIVVLSPIRYETLARSAHKSLVDGRTGAYEAMPQRQTVLADVDYLIEARVHAHMAAVDPARRAVGRTQGVYEEIIHRNLTRGVPFGVPHGGRSEFVLDVEYLGGAPAVGEFHPIDRTEPLGPMLIELLHQNVGGAFAKNERVVPIYRRLHLNRGVVEVPSDAYERVRDHNLAKLLRHRAAVGHRAMTGGAA